MTTLAAPTTYTPEDVARLSAETGKLYELVGGRLIEKPPISTTANWVATRVSFFLQSTYDPARAFVFVEQPTYCFDPGEMRRPDVALVWAERLPGGLSDDELRVVPDLIVEVVSPSNKYIEQMDRVEQWLDVGVPMVWLIEPTLRWAHVYRRDGSVTLLRDADTFQNDPLLPGLTLRIADVLPPRAPAPAAPPAPNP